MATIHNTGHEQGRQTPITRSAQSKRESGQPGGGAGRRDVVPHTGVYPASLGFDKIPHDAEVRAPGMWGQGARGRNPELGYWEAGTSELSSYGGQLVGGLMPGSYNPQFNHPGPNTGRGPRNYQRSDERIMEEVCEALTQQPDLDASGLEVRVENGEVQLDGEVESRRDKRLAVDLAESVGGVRDVCTHVHVRNRGA
ncbi:MAG TPA: BON domain-containing protein [Gemmatimonadales bacterium]|nr:BON domain-containing protein [Gemmatimonadales bacterium]